MGQLIAQSLLARQARFGRWHSHLLAGRRGVAEPRCLVVHVVDALPLLYTTTAAERADLVALHIPPTSVNARSTLSHA